MKEVSIRCEGARSISIDELFPFQDDIKTMKPSTLRKLEKVILEQGFSEPIAVWANSPDEKMWILNGHQRMTALQSLKSKGYFIPPIPVTMVQADDEQEARKKVLTLASQFGDFDGENLSEFVAKAQLDTEWIRDNARLAAGDFKLPMLITPVDEEPHPEPEAIPIVQRGEVYILGNHRLMCGDSTVFDEVHKIIPEQIKVDLVYADPPYGIDEETDRASAVPSREAKGNTFSKIIGDDSIDTAVSAYGVADLKADTICYWGGNYYAHKIGPSSCWIVWDKRVEENQRDKNSDCELAYVKHPSKKSVRIFRHIWKGMIKGSEHGDGRIHPTQKPVALAEWCFEELAPHANTVFDQFGGSGSTLIACEKTKRQCFMMELDPIYCGVILDRWESYSGKQAIRESDGRLWLDIKAEALST